MALVDGLNGLYHFNTGFTDASGNGRDLTNVGAVIETVSPILGAGSADYDGLNDHSHTSIGTAASDTEGQIAFWYNSPDNTGDHTIVAFDNGVSNVDMILLRMFSGVMDFFIYTASTVRLHLTFPIPAVDQDHCIIFGVDASGNYLTVDGTPTTPTYLTGNASTSFWLNNGASFANLRVGARKVGASISTPYNGLVDELAWSNRVWTTDEKNEYSSGVEIGITGEASHISFSIYDKQFNAFKELSGKNTIV
jgi:hypothetical protein